MLVSHVSHSSRIPCTARFQMGTTAKECVCLGGGGGVGWGGGRDGEEGGKVGGDVKYDDDKSKQI
jgi:hypothetical protein